MINYFLFKIFHDQIFLVQKFVWPTGPQHIAAAKLTNLMNLSFDRKSKLKIHKQQQQEEQKLCVFIQCCLTKEYANKRGPFFLSLFAHQSFIGQKAEVFCSAKDKDETGCKMSDSNAICLCLCLSIFLCLFL